MLVNVISFEVVVNSCRLMISYFHRETDADVQDGAHLRSYFIERELDITRFQNERRVLQIDKNVFAKV